MNRTTSPACAPFARRLRCLFNRLIMLDFDDGPVPVSARRRPPRIVSALSKRTDVYVSAAYQKASGSNTINGRAVPVQAEIGSSPSFVGSAGANTQFVTHIGLRHKS